ncbi:MAG: cobalamin-dependent protein, partial [Nocardioides sp.]
MSTLHVPTHPVRLVTASSLFDGHDASINIMRRIFQSQGCEVIHLGHNRSVQEVVDAALEEDVQGVAVSSYQGGHVEYFEYLVELLRAAGAGHVRVVGGGGGVIVHDEITRLRESGVTIFSPEDGQRLGLPGMVNTVVADCDTDLWDLRPVSVDQVLAGERSAVARAITGAELGRLDDDMRTQLRAAAERSHAPVLGLTGTGGSGKSSLTDEILRRFRTDQQDKLRVAVVAVDPTRRKGGGALLGDRIRMQDHAADEGVFIRSMASRGHLGGLSFTTPQAVRVLDAAGFDVVLVETVGVGQSEVEVAGLADTTMVLLAPGMGDGIQAAKAGILEVGDLYVVNKADRDGADRLRRDLRSGLALTERAADAWQPPILATVA